MTTNWKELLEKWRHKTALTHVMEAYGCDEFEATEIEWMHVSDCKAGHASLEPLLLKALEALELVCKRNDIPDAVLDYYGKCSMTLAEIKAELEGK